MKKSKTLKKSKYPSMNLQKFNLWLLDFADSVELAALKCKIHYGTIYSIKKGKRPSERIALKISRASYGEITMQDLGYEI